MKKSVIGAVCFLSFSLCSAARLYKQDRKLMQALMLYELLVLAWHKGAVTYLEEQGYN